MKIVLGIFGIVKRYTDLSVDKTVDMNVVLHASFSGRGSKGFQTKKQVQF